MGNKGYIKATLNVLFSHGRPARHQIGLCRYYVANMPHHHQCAISATIRVAPVSGPYRSICAGGGGGGLPPTYLPAYLPPCPPTHPPTSWGEGGVAPESCYRRYLASRLAPTSHKSVIWPQNHGRMLFSLSSKGVPLHTSPTSGSSVAKAYL